MKTINKILLIGFTLIGFTFLAGCQTVKGFGEDLEKGGHAIQKAAQGSDDKNSDTNTAKNTADK
jgi:predicted small secreted protein